MRLTRRACAPPAAWIRRRRWWAEAAHLLESAQIPARHKQRRWRRRPGGADPCASIASSSESVEAVLLRKKSSGRSMDSPASISAAKWRTPSKGSPDHFGGDEKVFERGPVSQLPFHEVHAGRQQIAPPMAQVIENNGLMPILGKKCRDGTAYVPCTAGNQYLHKKNCPFRTVWLP